MAKQVLEIEVPDGKKAIWKDGRVVFEDVDTMESIKTIEDAAKFLADKRICEDILDSLSRLPKDSFEWKIAAYRVVVAAVTYNEQRHLTTGERWFPTIEFCRPGKLKNCYGDIIVGRIKSEGEEFNVVGGRASHGALAGLGHFARLAACLTPGRISASGRLVQRKLPYTFLSNLESFCLRLVMVVQTVIGDGWHSHNLYISSGTIHYRHNL